MGYAHAAALYRETQYKTTVPLYIKRGGAQKQNTLRTFLSNLLADRHNWKKKRDKKEPLTGSILDAMLELVTLDPQGILSAMSAVYDWCHFNLFTGSRLGEYGQSKPPKGAPMIGSQQHQTVKMFRLSGMASLLLSLKKISLFTLPKRLPYPGNLS